ncbi:unnamed protein product, partial [Didymodactylos carnosus]
MKCIHHKFVEQAVNHPQKICVMLDEQSLTYGEVLHRVQYFASYLIRECNVQPGHIICQCVERSIEMVIGILSIFTTGAIYCALSSTDPCNRLCSLIEDAKAQLVLIHGQTRHKFIDLINSEDVPVANIEEIIINEEMSSANEVNLLSNVHVTIEKIA